MIQKCPHCGRDVIFTKGFCPNCGLTSADEERGEPTFLGVDPHKTPVYTYELDTAMTATQKRGQTLTSLVLTLILAPAIVYCVVRIYWLRPDVLAMAATSVGSWVCRKLWIGRPWAKPFTYVVCGAMGTAGVVTSVLHFRTINPVQLLAFSIWGVVYLWCAWTLLRSIDVREFLEMQRKIPRD